MRGKKLETRLGRLRLRNPVIAASGTFGYGREAHAFFDINRLGGFVTKTVTLLPRAGNLPPRIYDLGYGVINSIGLENPGVKQFLKEHRSFFKKLTTQVLISIYAPAFFSGHIKHVHCHTRTFHLHVT